MLAKLVSTDGLLSGTHETSKYVFGTDNIGQRTNSRSSPQFFNDFGFIGHWNNNISEVIDRSRLYEMKSSQIVQHVSQGFSIDCSDPAFVIEAQKYAELFALDGLTDAKFFEVNQITTLREIDLFRDEYNEVRKFNALEKLSTEEIKLLGLEKEAVHLKLKYGGEKQTHDDFL